MIDCFQPGLPHSGSNDVYSSFLPEAYDIVCVVAGMEVRTCWGGGRGGRTAPYCFNSSLNLPPAVIWLYLPVLIIAFGLVQGIQMWPLTLTLPNSV